MKFEDDSSHQKLQRPLSSGRGLMLLHGWCLFLGRFKQIAAQYEGICHTYPGIRWTRGEYRRLTKPGDARRLKSILYFKESELLLK